MSAKGRMGATKYQEKTLDDPEYTKKTYHIANDLKDPRQKSCDNTAKKVHIMEEKAINRPSSFMRKQVLHKGLWKHKMDDYNPPRDHAKIRAVAKEKERVARRGDFNQELE